MDKHWLRT